MTVSYLHEMLHELFRERPTFVADVLEDVLGVPLPMFESARLTSGELTDTSPAQYRADAVITLNAGGRPVQAVVVEAQLGIKSVKRRAWPAYLANLHYRLNCPVVLLVVTTKPAVARWSARMIRLGHPGFNLIPLVLGPDRVPVVADPSFARTSPELSALSVMAHGSRRGPGGVDQPNEPVLDAFRVALGSLDEDHARLYADVVLDMLPEAARNYLENLMLKNYEYRSDFARRYYGQGKAEGESRSVLAVLDARGIDVPDEVRRTITACTDLEQLDIWVRRAATAEKATDLVD